MRCRILKLPTDHSVLEYFRVNVVLVTQILFFPLKLLPAVVRFTAAAAAPTTTTRKKALCLEQRPRPCDWEWGMVTIGSGR